MKATLESRKKVRLSWFKQKKVPFKILRELEWKYTPYNAEHNEISHSVQMHYRFESLKQLVPPTDLIIFDKNGLPQAYMNTEGSFGNKFTTEKVIDHTLEVKDRIVSLTKGENKVSKIPVPPHEVHLYKEIQIHEREDRIKRKITIKNRTNKEIKDFQLTYIDTKDVVLVNAEPKEISSVPPEYEWSASISPEGDYILNFELKVYSSTTYKIEKDKTEVNHPNARIKPLQNEIFNQEEQSFR